MMVNAVYTRIDFDTDKKEICNQCIHFVKHRLPTKLLALLFCGLVL